MAKVTLHYWAALRAAAGVSEETFDAATLADALSAARSAHGADSRFASVLSICAIVVDETPAGRADPADVALRDGTVIELLPPYAGG